MQEPIEEVPVVVSSEDDNLDLSENSRGVQTIPFEPSRHERRREGRQVEHKNDGRPKGVQARMSYQEWKDRNNKVKSAKASRRINNARRRSGKISTPKAKARAGK